MTDETPATPELGPEDERASSRPIPPDLSDRDRSRRGRSPELPFFGAALGLILAEVYYAAGKLPDWKSLTNACPMPSAAQTIQFLGCVSMPAIATSLILATLITSGLTLYFLGIATRGRIYRRITQFKTVELARKFTTFHGLSAKWPGQIDNLVVTDLSDELIDQLVARTSNRTGA